MKQGEVKEDEWELKEMKQGDVKEDEGEGKEEEEEG